MHLAGLRRLDLRHRRAPELGRALAAAGGLRAGNICDEGHGHIAFGDGRVARGCRHQIHPVSFFAD